MTNRPLRTAAHDVPGLVLLKLGGALLTDKAGREALRPDVLAAACAEVAAWVADRPGQLVLAHGSGSFAHLAARETGFVDRPTPLAAARVAAAARRLDAHVVDALLSLGLAAAPLPGASWVQTDQGTVVDVRADLVGSLLAAGLLPVVYGDVVPDGTYGAAIASTEPMLAALAERLGALRLVLATDVDGVYAGDPRRDPAARPLARLTPADAQAVQSRLVAAGPEPADVTGGMGSKVALMMALVHRLPALEVRIVSGLRPGAISAALAGRPDAGGTVIAAR